MKRFIEGVARSQSTLFSARLWQIFRAIISGALSDLQEKLGCSVSAVMQTIDERINEFFTRSLQLDAFTMRLEYD